MSWYSNERGWLDSPVFNDAPYSERDAWQWLIGEAAFKEKKISVNGKPFTLSRGQLYASIRFMADKFQWSSNRVRRFLKRLENWQMVNTQTDTGQTLITICNYSKYQDRKTTADTAVNTHVDTGSDTPADTNNKKDKESKEIKGRVAALALEDLWSDFEEHRKKLKKPMTNRARKEVLTKLEQFKIQGFSPHEQLAKAIERGWLTVFEPRKENEGNRGNFNGNDGKNKSDRARFTLIKSCQDLGIT